MTHDNGAVAQLSAGNLAEEYRLELERQCKPSHTVRAYLGDLRSFLEYFESDGGSHFPGGVRTADVRAYLKALRAAGARPSTIHRRRAGLASFFRWAVATNRCRESPLEGVDVSQLAPLELPPRRALEVRDKRRFLRTVKQLGTLRDHAVCELLVATAILEDELVHIKLEDLELGEQGGWMKVNGKGSRQRTLPLHGDVSRVLASWLAARPALGPYLFPGRYGGALATSSIRRLVDKYERLSGVAGVAPQVLRHTTLTELVRRKKHELALVSAYAGHAKLSTTALYLPPNHKDLQAVADSLMED